MFAAIQVEWKQTQLFYPLAVMQTDYEEPITQHAVRNRA
jgi:hypothetical protein